MRVSDDPIEQASGQYDQAEQAFLQAVASGEADHVLRRLAQEVAVAAQSWNSADAAEDGPPTGTTRYYDVPEVLSTLWRDFADAYGRRGS